MQRPIIFNLISLTAIFTAFFWQAAGASGDIYHYVDTDGVACFTDNPAAASGAVLVVKERGTPRDIRKEKRTVPLHLSATRIKEKMEKSTNSAPPTEDFVLPVNGKITSPAGLRHDPIDGSLRVHNGVDIAIPSGTPVKPVREGTVVFSGARPGYGNLIIVDHPDGSITIYAHNLVNVSTEGDRVQKATTIALSGSTGRSTGPHLHFEAWKDGVNITSAYYAETGTGTGMASARDRGDGISRMVGSDGTLIFTNLH